MNHDEDTPDDGQKLEGRYANYFKVGHNAVEFLIDCGQLYHESEEVQLHTRIVTSPVYAKNLLEILQDAVERYEERFGEIREEGEE
jgi:hypothetical protein